MNSIAEFLFPAPATRSAPAIISWWEKRRLAYNVAVGVTGLFSYGLSSIIMLLPPHGQGGPIPIPLILLFGVMANICYLFGPVTEIVLNHLFGTRLLPTGPALYRMGLTFSIGLTILPIFIASIDFAIRVIRALFFA